MPPGSNMDSLLVASTTTDEPVLEAPQEGTTRLSKKMRIIIVVVSVVLLCTFVVGLVIGLSRPSPLTPPPPDFPNFVNVNTFPSKSPFATKVLSKRPSTILKRAVLSMIKVLFLLVLPIFAVSISVSYLFATPLPVPFYSKIIMMLFAGVALLAFLVKFGFPVLDDILGNTMSVSAFDALQAHNDRYFETNPIERLSPRNFSFLLFYFLKDSPVYLSGSACASNTDIVDSTISVNHVNTIGMDLLIDKPDYLPLWYTPPLVDGIEMAGRSKMHWLPRVDVQTISADAPSNSWSEWADFGHLVKQYGDDTIGVNLERQVFVVADGVSGSLVADHARYASLAVVLACLERVGVEGATVEEVMEPLLTQLVSFFNIVQLGGSTTVTVAQVVGDELLVAQMGDSTCMVVRRGEVVYHTRTTVHGFNCPFQFSRFWAPELSPLSFDRFPLLPGDRIYLYSDGVGDNLWTKDVIGLGSAGRIAAKAVHVFSEQLTADIPFNERPSNVPVISKGKRDDVSVLSINYSSLEKFRRH